jgi:hypothetical protein
MKFLKVAALMLVMAVGGAQPFPSRDVLGSLTKHNPKQIMLLAAVFAAAVIAQKIYGCFPPITYQLSDRPVVHKIGTLGRLKSPVASNAQTSFDLPTQPPLAEPGILICSPIRSYLCWAALHNNIDLVREMLHNASSLKQSQMQKNSDGRTPLHYACMHGNVEMVRALLNHPPFNPDAKDIYGYTPWKYLKLVWHLYNCRRYHFLFENSPDASILEILTRNLQKIWQLLKDAGSKTISNDIGWVHLACLKCSDEKKNQFLKHTLLPSMAFLKRKRNYPRV